MPEIGQRTLPLMHNLKKLAGIEEDTARKPQERSGVCVCVCVCACVRACVRVGGGTL